MDAISQTAFSVIFLIFKCNFLNDEKIWILIMTSLKVVQKGPINIIPALV